MDVEFYEALNLKKYPGTEWLCEGCCGNRSGTSNLRDLLLEIKKDLKLDIAEEIKKELNLLTKTMKNHIIATESRENEINVFKQNFPEIVQSEVKKINKNPVFKDNITKENNNIKHSLLIRPKDIRQKTYTKATWSDILKNSITSKLNDLPVQKTLLTSSGVGYSVFPNKESRDIAAVNLGEKCSITIQDKNLKSIYPKVKINGIPKDDFNKDNIADLRAELIRKNKFIKENVEEKKKTFQILFLTEQKDSNFVARIVKVDPIIKEMIHNNGNRVFLGLSSCKVTDRYYLVQCYRCQKFGHKKDSDKCSLNNTNDNVCLYCANNHLSRECPDRRNQSKHQCANCSNSANNRLKSNTGHCSNSSTCPILQAELKTLLSKTMGHTSETEIPKNLIVT